MKVLAIESSAVTASVAIMTEDTSATIPSPTTT